MFGLTKPGALCDEWNRKESNQELELSTTGDCHKGWYENRGHASCTPMPAMGGGRILREE